MVLDKDVPLIQLFPKIINRKAFLKKHPKINPVIHRVKYLSYWREEARRCIEGYWGKEEEGHWRWMSPDAYFYANHWIITDDTDGVERTVRPSLRDVDWYFFSVWTICRKFSGFRNDDEYNGAYVLEKYWQEQNGEVDELGNKITLTNSERRRLNRNKYLKNSKGEFKKYKNPFDIISDSYDTPMGLPCYDNPAQDLMCFSSRSIGKSFWASAIKGREFTFDGKRYYSDSENKNENTISVSGESGKSFAGSFMNEHVNLLYEKVFSGLDNFEGAYDTIDRIYPPPFYKYRLGTFNSGGGTVRHSYRVKYKVGGWRNKGSGSTFYKGVYSADINKAIGNRVNIAIIDESGLIPELPVIHAANRYVMERGGVKNGSILYIGTGGDIKKIEGSRSMFYNPVQNRLYRFKNLWEDSPEISMFIPAEYSLNEYRDENGNIDLHEAREDLIRRREEAAMGNDLTQFNYERMSMPLKPSDMFLVDGELVYNQTKVMQRISEINSLDDWREKATFGQIKCFGTHFDDVQIKRGTFEQMSPIISKTTSDTQDTSGCIIFYKEPTGKEEFKMSGSRYRIAYDPVRTDGSHVNRHRSFASILVWDTKHDKLAAEFIGRRETPEEVHNICLNLAIYYNCPVLYESNVRGFKNEALRRGLGYMLYPTPIKALSKKLAGLTYKEGDVGVEVTSKTKPTMIEYSQSFVNKRDHHGRTVYEKLNSLRLLEEMETWDGEINADHVSCFLILSTWEEEEKDSKPMHKPETEKQYNEFRQLMKERRYRQNIIQSVYH